MYSFQWTITTKRQIGKLPAGAWIEIIKTNNRMKPMMHDVFKAFESKYGVKVPIVSEQSFDFQKNF